MKWDAVIAVIMVLAALAALIIWEIGAKGLDLGGLAGDHDADEAMGGQDTVLPGAGSEQAANLWAQQGDFTGTLGYNETPWGPPRFSF